MQHLYRIATNTYIYICISCTDGFVFVFVAPAPSKSVGWAHKSHNSSRQLLRRRGALLCCCTTICSAALQWEILTQMQTVVKYRYFTISPPPNTKYKYKFELCLTTICSAALYHLCCDWCDRLSWENRFSSGAPPARPRISHIIDVTTHCGQCHNIDFTAAVNCMIL